MYGRPAMVSSTSATLGLTDDLVEFAKCLGNAGAKPFVAAATLIHRAALNRALDPKQGTLDAIHGFFEWLTAHGS